MGKFNFYYDESEHSRKINHKTITAENYSDSFIAVIVGWLSENQASLYERYGAFEEKYQHSYVYFGGLLHHCLSAHKVSPFIWSGKQKIE